MSDQLNSIIKPVLDLFQPIFEQLHPQFVWLSAALFTLTVLVFLGLLIYCAYQFFQQKEPKLLPTPAPDGQIEELREALKRANDQIRFLKQHTEIENFYFNLSGLTNAALVLCMALLLYELFRIVIAHGTVVTNRLPPDAAEISYIMATTICAIFASAVFVSLAQREGRSYEKISRATLVSLVVSALSFSIFAIFVSPIHQSH